MPGPPTLQALAIYARDHFGEDGAPFAGSVPSSFDIVVDGYVQDEWHAARQRIEGVVGARLVGMLASQDVEVTSELAPKVIAYVQYVLQFLSAQYPDVETLREERHLLTHLFWRHLVEARYASSRVGSRVSRQAEWERSAGTKMTDRVAGGRGAPAADAEERTRRQAAAVEERASPTDALPGAFSRPHQALVPERRVRRTVGGRHDQING